MTKPKAVGKPKNKRGSPEAIEKRKAARMFNTVLGGGRISSKLDGRTEKRRQRLMKELQDGIARGSRELKPIDVLQHVQELMDLGEPLSSIRKVTKVRPVNAPSESMVGIVSRLHSAYHFRPETYRFVGIGEDVLVSAGVLKGVLKGGVEGGLEAGEPGRAARAKKVPKRPPQGA